MGIIKDLATCTRNWAEDFIERPENVNHRYGKDLTGMCGIASAHLFIILNNHGITKVQLAANCGHIFLMICGNVLDVTATQFNNKQRTYNRVHWAKHRHMMHEWPFIWKIEETFSSVNGLMDFQDNWPPEQRVLDKFDYNFIKNPLKYLA
jgi:hypothetical protein